MQNGKVLEFVAEKAGKVLSPAFGAVGTLMGGVARLDPVSIIIVGLLVAGISLFVIYSRRYLAHRRRRPVMHRSVKVSDARLYSRYGAVTSALEEARIVRENGETPEEFARRAADEVGEPTVARLGEIYLYARFRDAVPLALVEEFDRLEPEALATINRLKETASVNG